MSEGDPSKGTSTGGVGAGVRSKGGSPTGAGAGSKGGSTVDCKVETSVGEVSFMDTSEVSLSCPSPSVELESVSIDEESVEVWWIEERLRAFNSRNTFDTSNLRVGEPFKRSRPVMDLSGD